MNLFDQMPPQFFFLLTQINFLLPRAFISKALKHGAFSFNCFFLDRETRSRSLLSFFCITFCITTCITQLVRATPEDVNVLIPLEFRYASGGLVYQGVELTSEEALNLHKRGIDLSKLNPREGTDVWRNEEGGALHSQLDAMLLDSSREVIFIDASMKVPGTIEFTVQQKDAQGVPHLYVVRVSRKIHALLLRKHLLRKVGYIVPPSQRVAKLKVRFKDDNLKKRDPFLKEVMWRNLVASPSRWISNFYGIKKVQVENVDGDFVERERYLFLPSGVKNIDPQSEDVARVDPQESLLEFQDVLVYPITNQRVIDLSLGFTPQAINQDLRLLNAVILIYALSDVPESVNKLSWYLGRISDNILVLPYEEYSSYAAQYQPSYEDLLWIMRRIARLDREDFIEATKTVGYPDEVATLVQEKLIARRNYLVDLLDLDFDEQPHYESSEINSENIVNGVVTKDVWPGYGSRFAHDPIASPLSQTEVASFFKSKLLENGLYYLTRRANEEILSTDISGEWRQHQIGQAHDNFLKFLETGEVNETPVGLWVHPTINGQITLSREIVAGTFLGAGNDGESANNMIHLADTFGFGIALGAIGLVEGLPVSEFASLKGEVFFSRNYTHLKPVKSIKGSLDEPMSHLFVNFYQSDLAQSLGDFDEFLDKFKVGESLIVTDAIGGQVEATVGQHGLLTPGSVAKIGLSGSHRVIHRLHIYRSDKNTIHVYKDNGNLNQLRFSFDLRRYIPLITLSFDINQGRAQTLFHHLDITKDKSKNPFLDDHIQNLRNILLSGSTEMFQRSPVKVEHHFYEKKFNLNLFFFRWMNLSSQDYITVTSPGGETVRFLRGLSGWHSGKNWQGLGINVANALIEELLEERGILKSSDSGDPSYTFKGSSKSRQVTLDFLLDEGVPTEDFVHVQRRWKGWELSARKARQIIREINSRFDQELFPRRALNSTKRILLYIIDLDVFVYESGINHLLELSQKQLKEILSFYDFYETPRDNGIQIADSVQKFFRDQKACKERQSTGDVGNIRVMYRYGELGRKKS